MAILHGRDDRGGDCHDGNYGVSITNATTELVGSRTLEDAWAAAITAALLGESLGLVPRLN